MLAPIVGSWGTKIDAVVRSILDTLKGDSSAKILLFAEWTEVLDVAGEALKMNGVGCLSLRPGAGGKGRGRGRGRGKGRGKGGDEGLEAVVKGLEKGKGKDEGGKGGKGGKAGKAERGKIRKRGGGAMAEKLRLFRESEELAVLMLPLSVCISFYCFIRIAKLQFNH